MQTTGLDNVTKEAMKLSSQEKLILAEFLLENAGSEAEAEAEAEAERAWELEIRDRILAIDAGQVVGVSYEEVMAEAESRLIS